MKKAILKTLALVMLAGSINLATAKGGDSPLKVEVIQRKGNIVAVHLDKPSAEAVKVKITKKKFGTAVYSKTFKTNDLTVTKYDLSNLPVGDYTVEVESGSRKFVKQISVK